MLPSLLAGQFNPRVDGALAGRLAVRSRVDEYPSSAGADRHVGVSDVAGRLLDIDETRGSRQIASSGIGVRHHRAIPATRRAPSSPSQPSRDRAASRSPRCRPPGFSATIPMTTCNWARNISAATILALPRRAFAAPPRYIRAMQRLGSGLLPPTTGCAVSISPTAPTPRPSVSSGRPRKFSTIRGSPTCCAATSRERTGSSKKPRPRTRPIPTSEPISNCWRTPTARLMPFSEAGGFADRIEPLEA